MRKGNKEAEAALTLSDQNGAGSVMSRADEYRDYAARCVRLAQRTENPADKAMLLQMAETWRRLAQRIEQDSSENSEPH